MISNLILIAVLCGRMRQAVLTLAAARPAVGSGVMCRVKARLFTEWRI